MLNGLRNSILDWFVGRDAHGSQTNGREQALTRAAGELADDLTIDHDVAVRELDVIRKAGLVETVPGVGPYRGAWVTRITKYGRDALYAPQISGPAQTIFDVKANTIGVVGTVTGGTVTQSIGGSFADLIAALEQFRDEMKTSNDPRASVVEATAEQVALLVRTPEPDRNLIVRALTGMSQVVQTLAAVPQAWALLASEAAKAGFGIQGQ
jgi:hypothetical protein